MAKDDEKRYIIKSIRIPGDQYNVRRIRVELTPAMCEICGADLAEINKLGRWEDLTETHQKGLRDALRVHKKTLHSPPAEE